MVPAVVGRENAEQKFTADAGVGGVGRRPLQIGGVLNGQNVFVKRGGVGVLLRGGVFRAADGFDPVLFGGAKAVAGGLNGRGLGIRPAFELQHGQVRGIGDGAKHDVHAAQIGAEVIGVMWANLKFLMQLHGLAGKGELGGLGRLRHALMERVQIIGLRLGELAEFALGGFLAGDIAGDFLAERVGGGDEGVTQPQGDFRVCFGGGDDESAVVRDDGNGNMRAFGVHVSSWLRVGGCRSRRRGRQIGFCGGRLSDRANRLVGLRAGFDLSEFGALGAKITAYPAAGAGIQQAQFDRQLFPVFPHFRQFTLPGVNFFQQAVIFRAHLFIVLERGVLHPELTMIFPHLQDGARVLVELPRSIFRMLFRSVIRGLLQGRFGFHGSWVLMIES